MTTELTRKYPKILTYINSTKIIVKIKFFLLMKIPYKLMKKIKLNNIKRFVTLLVKTSELKFAKGLVNKILEKGDVIRKRTLSIKTTEN
jgi:hypothetical protein